MHTFRNQAEFQYMETSRRQSGDGLRTLERGLAVLDHLSAADGGCQLSAVAHVLGLSPGTTHRVLRTLVGSGYVEQDAVTKRYQLGVKVLALSGGSVPAMRLAAEARPLLRALMQQAGLAARLAVYHAGSIVYVDRIDTLEGGPRFMPVGAKAPAYATSLGKALLAYQTPEEIENVLASPMPSITAWTITDPERLRLELEDVRRTGYAVDRRENHSNIFCIGAPVLDAAGRAVAAVSVAGHPSVVEGDIPNLAYLVIATARALSRRLDVQETAFEPEREEVHA